MPSFDVVSEIDMAEMANALLMARKELASRFDFKGVEWEIAEEKDKLDLTMTGAGELQPEEGSKGPSIEQIKARPYDKLYVILGIAFAILAIGGTLLYRSEAGK